MYIYAFVWFHFVLLQSVVCFRLQPFITGHKPPAKKLAVDQVRHLLFVSVIFCSVFSLIRPPLVDAHSQIPRHLLHLSDRHLPPLGALCVQILKCAEGRNVSVFSPNPVRQCCLYFFNATQNGPSPHREVSQTSAFTAIH